MRALVKRQISTEAVTQFSKFTGWQKVAETESEINGQLPFRAERPFIINSLKPVYYSQQWWLQDEENKIMQVRSDYKNIWKLLSMSGGKAMDMAVIGKEDQFEPMGVWQENEYKIV